VYANEFFNKLLYNHSNLRIHCLVIMAVE